MAVCICVAKWGVARCFLEEGHEGGHRGAFVDANGDQVIVAWHGNVTDRNVSDPIIVGTY